MRFYVWLQTLQDILKKKKNITEIVRNPSKRIPGRATQSIFRIFVGRIFARELKIRRMEFKDREKCLFRDIERVRDSLRCSYLVCSRESPKLKILVPTGADKCFTSLMDPGVRMT